MLPKIYSNLQIIGPLIDLFGISILKYHTLTLLSQPLKLFDHKKNLLKQINLLELPGYPDPPPSNAATYPLIQLIKDSCKNIGTSNNKLFSIIIIII